MSDALRMLMEGRGGSASLVAFPFRSALPNFASRYAGRAPYSLSPIQQTIADVLAERAMP